MARMPLAPARKTHATRPWIRASSVFFRAWEKNRPIRRRERKALARMRRLEMARWGYTVS